VDLSTGGAALATVYVERVEQFARTGGADQDVLLGRAIAHEVGHLLLKSNVHAATGLMRERWTGREMFRNRPDDWGFSAPELARLRALWGHADQTASN